MAQGGYDHPSYLTRQNICLGVTVAGAGTTMRRSFPTTTRIRNVSACATIAGTQTSWNITIQNGTSSVGVLTMGGTAAVGAIATSGDLNTTLTAGTALNFNVVGEATGVVAVVVEAHLDPAATWS